MEIDLVIRSQRGDKEAFAILAKASSHRNIKVRRVAEDILDKLPEGPPRAHFGR